MSLCGLRLDFWTTEYSSLNEPLAPGSSESAQSGIVQQTAAVAGQAFQYLLLLPARMRAAKLDWQQISQMHDIPIDLLAAMKAQQLLHVHPSCFTEAAIASLMALPSGRYNLLHARPGTYDYGLVHPEDAVEALLQLSSDAIDHPRAFDYARMARVLTEVRHVESIVNQAPEVFWIILGSLRPTLLRDLVDQGWFDTSEHMKGLLRHISIDQIDRADHLFDEPRCKLLQAIYRVHERRAELGYDCEKAYNFGEANRQYYDPSSEQRIFLRTLKNMMAHYRIGTSFRFFDGNAAKGEAYLIFRLIDSIRDQFTDLQLEELYAVVIKDLLNFSVPCAEDAVEMFAPLTHVSLIAICADLRLEKAKNP